MKKYYYVLNADGSIARLASAKNVPAIGVQISKADYDRYVSIAKSVEDREGYDKHVKIYPDFSYTVEYTPIEVIEVNEE